MNSNSVCRSDECAVTRYHFDPCDRVVISDVEWIPVESSKHGHVLRRVDLPAVCRTFTHEEVWELYQQQLLFHDHRYFSEGKARLRAQYGTERLMHFSPQEKAKIEWRELYCRRFLEMEANGEASRSDTSMNQAIARIHEDVVLLERKRQKSNRCWNDLSTKTPPRASTLRSWLRTYQISGYESEALRDVYKRSGNKSPRFSDTVLHILEDVAQQFADRRRPSKVELYKRLEERINHENKERLARGLTAFPVPGKKALLRRIDRLDPFLTCVAREGEEVAMRQFQPTVGGLAVRRALERVEMDEYKVDLQVLQVLGDYAGHLGGEARDAIEAGRVWITTALDCATRCVLAVTVSTTPNAAQAIATLNMAVNEKERFAQYAGCATPWDMHGVPESVYTDGGPSFISHEFGSTLRDLEVEGSFGIVGQPQLRGRVERSYRRFHNDFFALFDGRTFKDVVEKGSYDSERFAVLDVPSLERLIIRYIVDVYHNTPHAGLDGETPRNAWRRLMHEHGVLPSPRREHNRHIFGVPVLRKVSKEGIGIFGLRYQSEQLQRLARSVRGAAIPIRIDPIDVGEISVLIEPHGWISVPCLWGELAGVALSEWEDTARRLRRQFQEAAALAKPVVLQALQDIRNYSEEATARAGLPPPTVSSEQLESLDRNLFKSFAFARADEQDAPPLIDLDDRDYGEVSAPDDEMPTPPAEGEVAEGERPSWAERSADVEGDDLGNIGLED